jgi:hypothetical protein
VVWPVFKTAMEAPPAAPVGSIPTRSRHPRRPAAHFLLGLLALVLGATASLPAQDSARVRPRVSSPVARPDTSARQSISPLNALWRSLLLPGWGQARLNRKLSGGLFVAWEGVTVGMSIKTRRELRYLRRTNSERAEDKRQEHEDWVVLLAFNHLFAGLEAFVGAHLADFPGDLRFQAMPGGAGVGLSFPMQLR